MASYVKEFIPEIWSATVLDSLEKSQVFGRLANRNYQSDLIYGDKVRIPQVGYPTINSYTRNNSTTGLTKEHVNVSDMFISIDQEKYFNVMFDEVDIKQSAVDFMGKLSERAAYKLSDTQDAYISGLYTQCGITTTSNSASTYVVLGSSNVRTQLLLLSKAFDKANVPYANRWLTVPPELMFELVDAGILEQSNNDQIWANGRTMNAYGWQLIPSNNISSPSTASNNFRLLAGVGTESITLVEQLQQFKMGEQMQEGFGYFLKGLHVYGARIIPDRTGVIYATINNA